MKFYLIYQFFRQYYVIFTESWQIFRPFLDLTFYPPSMAAHRMLDYSLRAAYPAAIN
tara:strand:- start:87 stop:257 length:171 start_codon:yes stop_codon:yes gene_type:complete